MNGIKRIAAVIIVLALCVSVFGCKPSGGGTPVDNGENNVLPETAEAWIDIYNEKAGDKATEKVIMSLDEILDTNKGFIDAAEYMVDVVDFESRSEEVTDEKLKEWLGAEISYDPCYKADGSAYTADEINAIYGNRNIDAASVENITRGITVARANVRTVPYGGYVLKAPDNMPYDRIQETELNVAMPVWIMHESLDGGYYYVQSYYYRGWVEKATVAKVVNDEDWAYFAEPENFVVVTDKMLTLDGRKVDMGVALPLESKTEDKYVVALPTADEAGSLTRKSVNVAAESANEGYLEYTMANFYVQAFKYLGTIYGWGGMNNGIDCSSFICSVMRSFGFKMPRNTSQQNKIMCSPITLGGMSNADKEKLFDGLRAPAALFSSGHVTLVLGESNGKYFIIHAPAAGKPVAVNEIDILSENYTYLSIIG